VGADGAAAVERQDEMIGLGDIDDLAAQQFEPRRVPGFELGVEEVADIGAEQPARHEAALVERHATLVALLLPEQPVDKIARPVLKGAHLAGGHVEQMIVVAGAIGETAAELRVALDQQHSAERTSPQQVQRQQGAAEAAADDGDRHPRRIGLPRRVAQLLRYRKGSTPAARRRR
jgi:hypothetical protein